MPDPDSAKAADAAAPSSPPSGEGRYRALFDGLEVPVVITLASDDSSVYVNPAYVRLIGAESIVSAQRARIGERLHPDFLDKARRNVDAIIRGEEPIDDPHYRLVGLDGQSVDVDIYAMPTSFEGESAMFSVLLDRSEQQHTAEFARSIVDCIPIGLHFFRLEDDDRLVFTGNNPAAQDILDIDHTALVGLTLEEAFPANSPQVGRAYRTVARDGGSWSDEDIFYDDGGQIVASFAVRAFRTGPRTMVAAFSDVTDRKRNETALAMAREELEDRIVQRTEALSIALDDLAERNRELAQATAAKDAFLAAMSHELRTPLNSIIGFSSVLLQGMAGPLTPEQLRQLEMINGSGRRLLSLIGDVLDLTVVEQGRVTLDIREFDPCELAAQVTDTVRPMAEEQGLSIATDLSACPGPMRSDQLKVEQILLNLVSNAIKYTPAGSVTVRVEPRIDDRVAFSVADTGPGIPERDLERIFEEFRQLPMAGVAKPEGTGLGLSIARRLAETLGGSLTVDSTEDVGSTFTLELPRDCPATVETQVG